MFTPEFFAALRKATDEVIVMDGIDRTQVQSIFTPNVRYLEVVEEGIEAGNVVPADFTPTPANMTRVREDRKSTRLNSSHSQISYAVFCLKKKKNDRRHIAHYLNITTR